MTTGSHVFDLAQQANAGIVRTTVYWSRIARDQARERRQPVRPRLPLRRSRRVRPQRGPARHGGHADDLGHARLGERRQGPELRTDQHAPTCRTSRGRSRRATRAATTATRSSASTRSGTSRTSASSSRRSTTRRASRSRPRSTRSSTAPPTPGSRRGNARALVGIGETSARGRDRYLGQAGDAGDRVARQVRRAALRSRSRLLRFDAWSHHPYPTSTRRGSRSQNVRWPNVTLTQLPRFEDVAQDLVPARRTCRSGSRSTATRRSPAEPKGVTYAQQAAYLRQALNYRRRATRTCRCSSGSSSATTRRAPGRAGWSPGTGRRSRHTPRSPASRTHVRRA